MCCRSPGEGPLPRCGAWWHWHWSLFVLLLICSVDQTVSTLRSRATALGIDGLCGDNGPWPRGGHRVGGIGAWRTTTKTGRTSGTRRRGNVSGGVVHTGGGGLLGPETGFGRNTRWPRHGDAAGCDVTLDGHRGLGKGRKGTADVGEMAAICIGEDRVTEMDRDECTTGHENKETVTFKTWPRRRRWGTGNAWVASELTREATWAGSGGNTTAPNADRKYRDEDRFPRTGADEKVSAHQRALRCPPLPTNKHDQTWAMAALPLHVMPISGNSAQSRLAAAAPGTGTGRQSTHGQPYYISLRHQFALHVPEKHAATRSATERPPISALAFYGSPPRLPAFHARCGITPCAVHINTRIS